MPTQMREQDLKKYKQEVETTLAGIKSHRKPDPNFDLQKYIGTHFAVTGLSMPPLRAAFKHGYSFSHLPLDEQYQIYKYIYFNSEIFDVLLQALFFNEIYVRQAEPEFIFNELIEWIDRIDNWAHSDMLTHHFAYLLEHYPNMVYPHLQAWNISENPWYRRQSVLSLLGYARFRNKKPTFNKIIALVKPLLTDKDYYVQKGVGWCLRETGLVYPEKTLAFLNQYHHLITSTAFAAASEKLPVKEKEKLKALRKKSRKK